MARNAPGRDGCLDALTARLDGGPVPEPAPEWFLARAEHYVDAFGLGEGTVSSTADGHRLRFERDLVQPVEEGWACLTAADGEQEGAPPLRCTHGYVEPGGVTAVDPPHTLEYAWCRDGVPAGTVRFALRDQEPIGCRLVRTQTVLGHLGELFSHAHFVSVTRPGYELADGHCGTGNDSRSRCSVVLWSDGSSPSSDPRDQMDVLPSQQPWLPGRVNAAGTT